MEKKSFHPESALGHALVRWWKSLENNRGARAELRRAHDLTTVALSGAYQRFYRQMIKTGWYENLPSDDYRNECLVAIAGLLAHVKSEDTRKMPVIFSEGEKPSFSELRFRRLLESSTLDEVFVGLRRALPLVSHRANLHDLANALLFWGDKIKKEWAYAYHWPEQS